MPPYALCVIAVIVFATIAFGWFLHFEYRRTKEMERLWCLLQRAEHNKRGHAAHVPGAGTADGGKVSQGASWLHTGELHAAATLMLESDSYDIDRGNSFGSTDFCIGACVNPATGLLMISGNECGVDVGGSFYGTSSMSDSWS
ncbi:hypothetical protein SQW19_16485 [Stenotrophomonas acidaminiphila]|uniref:hypothetical protein n=1 Tax=Stenotrophomonas acidaminiphila TaxID=128780 RepID=UPI002ABE145B|nr:hypothetical protein [Stenotrophomonas acidaminiphila]WPU55903.1 hypothetical protein SQW19_16485 [Stenotrophomonas acidaminiphila]